MKLQPKYIKGIFYGVGVLILLIVIAVIKPSLDDKHDELQATNNQLSAEVAQLEQLEANAASYESQAKEFEEQDAVTLDQFPAEVRAEDIILYAKHAQDLTDMEINSVGLTPGNLLYAMNAAPADAAVPAETTDDTTADTQATDAGEGTASGFDPSLGVLDEASVVKPDYNLYQIAVSYDFTSTYGDLKKIMNDILTCEDKQNIGGVSLSYDSETGNIAGSLNINRYYVTGTDKVYESPDAGNIQKGTNNIFGTLDNPQGE